MAFSLWIISIFISVFVLGTKTGFSFFISHLVLALLALYGMKNISRNLIPWLLLPLIFFSANYPRFSLEYFLIALGLIGLGLEPLWINANFKKRRNILLIFFGIFLISDFSNFGFNELGSLVLWLPAFLVLYYEKITKKNSLVYLASGTLLFFAKKKAAFIAFILSLRNKYLYLISSSLLAASFLFLENFEHFYKISIHSRLNLWTNTLKASLTEPFLGHGFGTFALSYPTYKNFTDAFGSKANQIITHAHSTLFSFIFELGLLGLIILMILSYLIYINNKKVFFLFVFILIVDASIISFSQYLLVSILFSPFIKDFGIFGKIFQKFNSRLLIISQTLTLIFSTYIFTPSLIGHFHFSKSNYDAAIKWDPQNSFYYFLRGAINLKKDLAKSELDLKKAVALTPTAPQFHGFLAAAQLGLGKLDDANYNIDLAINRDGNIGYWYLIKAYANSQNRESYEKYRTKAINLNPKIKLFTQDPQNIPRIIPRKTTKGNFQSNLFYRWGPEIDFPIPVPLN